MLDVGDLGAGYLADGGDATQKDPGRRHRLQTECASAAPAMQKYPADSQGNTLADFVGRYVI